MVGNIVSHLKNDDDDVDDTSKDLMTFCMQLIHHSQWKSSRVFICGSHVEIRPSWDIIKYFDLNHDKIDFDVMMFDPFHYAIHRSVSLQETYTGDVISIYTDNIHTGYVSLIKEKNNTVGIVLGPSLWKLKNDQELHGPAVMSRIQRPMLRLNKYSLSNANMIPNKFSSEIIQTLSLDIVFAVHCPYWPVEATEWITRRRSHGFPSKFVSKRIVRYGCDLVPISHNRLCNDGEWRFSFSKAEALIIKSWTISQRIVYATLWVLNKRIGSRNLCTYYFKTLMFWACEEKSPRFWGKDLIGYSACELLILMTQWIKSRFCVNYFIPGNNMMYHLTNTDLSYEIDALWRTFQSHQVIEEVIKRCQIYELLFAITISYIESPAWIKRAFVIYQRINNIYDNYTDILSADLTKVLQNALYVELADINRGLRFQQRSASAFNSSDKHSIYILKSENHLLHAVNLCESHERDVMDNCSQELWILMLKEFMPCDRDASSEASIEYTELNTKCSATADRQNSLNYHSKYKYLLYSRTMGNDKNKLGYNDWDDRISEERNVNFAMYKVIKINASTDINSFTHTDVQFYKEYPGLSPTVNISWFIAKAYLANLYYTTQLDVSLTIKTCDDIINVCRQSHMNEEFAEKTFPVVLSTQWTSIYDKEIQELLGFYSLCSYVFDASSRSVYLGVCPVLFAHYLKLRIEIDQLLKDPVFCNSSTNECIDDYNKHIKACKCDKRVDNGLLAANITLRLLCERLTRRKQRDTIHSHNSNHYTVPI